MAEVRPFRGIRYSPSFVEDLSTVVSPPYDIISPLEAGSLRRRSPYNAVNLELTYEDPGVEHYPGRYTRPAGLFLKWLQEGVLLKEPSPTMYLLGEEFTVGDSARRRPGLVAVVRLEEFENGIVMPHEHTTAGPKTDRLALMKATQSNFSPLMCLYRDPDGAVGRLLDQACRASPHSKPIPKGSPATSYGRSPTRSSCGK